MLRPDTQWQNPVMFVVEIGAVLTLLFVVQAAISSPRVKYRRILHWSWISGCG